MAALSGLNSEVCGYNVLYILTTAASHPVFRNRSDADGNRLCNLCGSSTDPSRHCDRRTIHATVGALRSDYIRSMGRGYLDDPDSLEFAIEYVETHLGSAWIFGKPGQTGSCFVWLLLFITLTRGSST
jgi:hypothetical protein